MTSKRLLALALAALLSCGLAGCGSATTEGSNTSLGSSASESGTSENSAVQSGTEESGGESTPDETAGGTSYMETETVDYVKNAMEKANLLTTTDWFLTPDGTILTLGEPDSTFYPAYAGLKPKKIIVSASASAIYALTAEGDLYFLDEKIAENVKDMEYATTNMNEEGFFITNDGELFTVYKKFGELQTSAYQVLEQRYLLHTITGLAIEKHDGFFLNEEGQIISSGDPEHWADCDFSGWSNLALVTAAKLMSTEERGTVAAATVAAIQKDGTVLAAGAHADEILSWGPLAYISMSDGIIVGLTKDGALRVAGETGDWFKENTDLESTAGIAAVRTNGEDIFAVGTDGRYHIFGSHTDTHQILTAGGDQ